MSATRRLILVRHGESQWNLEGRFTGWADVDLTDAGVTQMREAAAALASAGITFDLAFTSVLRRCIRSQWVLQDAMGCMWVPIVPDWRLNERHYGDLTGRLKEEAVRIHGQDMVNRWRRSYDTAPPPLLPSQDSPVVIDRRYRALRPEQIPCGESLHQTVDRVDGVWSEVITPALQSGQQVLVMAHGNSLRALIKIIEGLSGEECQSLEVPNAAPLIYELDETLMVQRKTQLTVAPRQSSTIL
ncbi:MAG: hypothetical protein A3G29_05980 [Burkholderiales bacterium RIFCSPLOWO2_12_FULL_64_99]|nr:MAG: hypothetical protein A3E52_03035 [Burkholderiales bacterium RIFCSPHIGHO2_12_FULL_63_20]OGB61045.1 MAG: hypothetical protein A3G29_05980 [Burkholderiales bacterium RIFCSPLOWO2_12_FULL_64_99]